jgi:hypothetical protein
MIEFSVSFIEFILATFIPIYVGMVCATLLQTKLRFDIRYLSAFALGLMFWFFFDTLNDAVQLDVNEGFSFSGSHVALFVIFVFGFLVIALPSTYYISRSTDVNPGYLAAFIGAIIVAVGMGFHGVGEGLEFGGLSAGTEAATVLDAIGGMSGGVSYVIHKFLEAIIVTAIFLGIWLSERSSPKGLFSKIAVLGFAFGLPSAIGEVIGYFAEVNAAYFFALGGGAALAVGLLIALPMFRSAEPPGLKYGQWLWTMVAVLLGFICLYGAALFHSG